MALVCERTTPIERLQIVGEDSANFCGLRMSRGQQTGALWPYPWIFRKESLLYVLICTHEVEWTSLQTHYFSKSVVVC
jgi:hypothetical protein